MKKRKINMQSQKSKMNSQPSTAISETFAATNVTHFRVSVFYSSLYIRRTDRREARKNNEQNEIEERKCTQLRAQNQCATNTRKQSERCVRARQYIRYIKQIVSVRLKEEKKKNVMIHTHS